MISVWYDLTSAIAKDNGLHSTLDATRSLDSLEILEN